MECKEYKQKCKLTNFFYFGFELLIIQKKKSAIHAANEKITLWSQRTN